MTKQPTRSFDDILDDVSPRNTALPKQQKPKQINIPLDAETKKLLDRVIHHKGKTTTQMRWLTEVIVAAINADPDSRKPVHGE